MASVLSALANDFSMNSGAHGPEPLDIRGGEESLVRMVEEELTFHFGKWETRVHARFVFENTSADSTVRQLSGFPERFVTPFAPIGQPYLDEWEISEFDQSALEGEFLDDLETRLDGRLVPSLKRTGFVHETIEVPWGWVPADTLTGKRVCWHIVELVIPPGGRVTLERSYRTGNGYQGIVGAHFDYVTITGGPWRGTIGRLTADVILEDGLTPDHLRWCTGEFDPWCMETYPPRHEWQWLAKDRLHLVWTDFDPLLDERKHYIMLSWVGYSPQDMREYHGERFASRWWPWHWFE